MPAGCAAKCRNMKIPPEKSKRGVYVFGRNSLQREIAADWAMGAERVTQRHQPGVEARSTTFATPGVDAKSA